MNDALTPQDLANELKLSRRRIYELLDLGEWPSYTIGDGPKAPRRVDRVDFEAWKQNRKEISKRQ